MQNYKWRNIMKKQTILAFTTALGIAMSVSAPVEAASANRVNISVYEKDCTTNQWNSVETGSINGSNKFTRHAGFACNRT